MSWVRIPSLTPCDVSRHRNGPEPTIRVRGFFVSGVCRVGVLAVCRRSGSCGRHFGGELLGLTLGFGGQVLQRGLRYGPVPTTTLCAQTPPARWRSGETIGATVTFGMT